MLESFWMEWNVVKNLVYLVSYMPKILRHRSEWPIQSFWTEQSGVKNLACLLICLLIKEIIMDKKWYVYILASKKWWVLYTWVTSNLEQRILQHKQWIFEWFTKKYCVHKLVRFQEFPTIIEAIEYEKIIKWWKREKKIKLIEEENKERKDLSEEWK